MIKLSTRILAVCGMLALLGGCSLAPRHQDLPPVPRSAYSPVAAETTAGAIYTAGRDIAYFEDLKAKRVGDTITVLLRETTNASKSSSTATSKESNTSMSGPTLFGRPVTHNGVPILDTSIEGSRDFSGEGSSSQSNQLVGSITVTVVEQLPNGNLVVEGDKWLTLNQGDEQIHIAGIIRPFDIAPDNTITSDRVGEARIRYNGRGTLASSNKPGWLSRFFNSAIWPY